MRDKELRLALICYGGISLAVYMHGITREIWQVVRASERFNRTGFTPGESPSAPCPYDELLAYVAGRGIRLRVMVDIIAGASAGGINGIFLGQAIATGQSLDPLTDLWLDKADVDQLLDPDARPWSWFSKWWAVPIAWLALRRPGGSINATVEPESRAEVRRKLSNFVRGRWFAPPFGGPLFTRILLTALDAMAQQRAGPRLLPANHPLDLLVTVTDFGGHAEWLKLSGTVTVEEHEHRLTIGFTDDGRKAGPSIPSLAFAARATASFPGAFPPFTVTEMDDVLRADDREWADRTAFMARLLPHMGQGTDPESLVLIDGSVLANAPFKPAMQALRDRPARREIDRRFVYIDPKPGMRGGGGRSGRKSGPPGFFTTIFGALSDIPREQPIRDNLEALELRSSRIRRMQHILDAVRPEVEVVMAETFGHTLFLDRPTPARLNTWRQKAQHEAAKRAGYFYPSYGHLKLSQIAEELARIVNAMLGNHDALTQEIVRQSIWTAIRVRGIDSLSAMSAEGASDATIDFFRSHDLGFRIRRLRMLNRKAATLHAATKPGPEREAVQAMREVIFTSLADYLDRERVDFHRDRIGPILSEIHTRPEAVLDAIAEVRNLRAVDEKAEQLLADGLAQLPKQLRRDMLLGYLGFPFYDIATLPLLQEADVDEFDPITVDRISPIDAQSLRKGGPEATLKGIQFNSFGAFFSRRYRENDYLWGRLHGAERMIDIILSSLERDDYPDPKTIMGFKRASFVRILAEERPRLLHITSLIDELEAQIAGWE